MLIFHIGLPKTATTFLQKKIFPKEKSTAFRGNFGTNEGRMSSEYIRRLIWSFNPDDAKFYLERTAAHLHDIWRNTSETTLLVSDENISIPTLSFWYGESASPQHVGEKLLELSNRLAPYCGDVRIMLGVRRQDRWLASRYAESSRHGHEFSPKQFEKLVESILHDNRPLHGWLEYNSVYSLLSDTFGKENVFIYSLEAMHRQPEETLEAMGEAAGGADFVTPYKQALDAGDEVILNKLSEEDEEAWQLKNGRGRIVLSPAIKERILTRYAEENRRLGEHFPLCFDD